MTSALVLATALQSYAVAAACAQGKEARIRNRKAVKTANVFGLVQTTPKILRANARMLYEEGENEKHYSNSVHRSYVIKLR